jgi:hypothetical protein
MENAHLRMGIFEYDRQTEKTATRVRVRVSHYMGEEESAHLVSVFGNDSDVGAITAAVYEQARFRLTFPDGIMHEVTLGEGATCCRGGISIPGRKQTVRHMIALSEEIRGLKSLSRTFLLRTDATEAWTAIVHRLGLPAIPDWAQVMMRVLAENNRITPLEGIGCSPVVVSASTEEVLEWMEAGVARGELRFPEKNGSVLWPAGSLSDALMMTAARTEKAA